jgi:hypothetical protein
MCCSCRLDSFVPVIHHTRKTTKQTNYAKRKENIKIQTGEQFFFDIVLNAAFIFLQQDHG